MPGSEATDSELAERHVSGGLADAGDARLSRVHLSADDVARTRFCPAPAPLVEAVMGLVMLRRRLPGMAGSRWASRAQRAFPATARPVLDLIPRTGIWPDFLSPVVTDLDQGLEIVRATPRQVLSEEVALSWRRAGRPPLWLRALADRDPEALEVMVRGLRDFHAACVAPHWPGILRSFRADVSERVAVLAADGLAGVFGTLHEDLSWRDRSLETSGRACELWLNGNGLQIVPSAIWTGMPWFSLYAPQWGNALIYPARPAGTSYSANGPRDLAGLLGRTRAAALRALREPCSTAELATRLGISAPSASEHATALRAADLVQTVRRGRAVHHSLTPLGRSLLDGPAT